VKASKREKGRKMYKVADRGRGEIPTADTKLGPPSKNSLEKQKTIKGQVVKNCELGARFTEGKKQDFQYHHSKQSN